MNGLLLLFCCCVAFLPGYSMRAMISRRHRREARRIRKARDRLLELRAKASPGAC